MTLPANLELLHHPTDKRAGHLEAADFERTVFAHTMAPDTDWQVALDASYWTNVAEQLRPGDRIEVHSADHRVQFEMLILACNHRARPRVHLECGFRALWPLDLELPEPTKADRARFSVRKMAGMANRFEIYDGEAGAVVATWLPRDAALDQAAARELGAPPEAPLPAEAPPAEPPQRAKARPPAGEAA
ncbi:MAG: hypothetical protein ACREFB_19005 [Stellaceae bacterium]